MMKDSVEKIKGKSGAMLFSELKCKDVINIRDCKKLGRVCNLDLMPVMDVSVRLWFQEEIRC